MRHIKAFLHSVESKLEKKQLKIIYTSLGCNKSVMVYYNLDENM